MAGTIAGLFGREPRQWGLRGDPWLWRALRERFAEVTLPEVHGCLEALLRVGIAEEIGVPLTSPHATAVFVERFAHGGMSSGTVSLPWWRDTGLPMLLRRAGLPGARFAIRVTTEDDWASIRSLRIENATENPISYGATLDATLRMTEDDWRERGRRGTRMSATALVAVDDASGRWIGTMGAQEAREGAGCLLTGVFVVPEFRGRRTGVADALFGEVLAWTVHRSPPLRLWVNAGEDGLPARRFYERHRFAVTGNRRPIGFTEGELVEMVHQPR